MVYGPEKLIDARVNLAAAVIAVNLGASPPITILICLQPAAQITAPVIHQVGHNDLLPVIASQWLVAQLCISRLARLKGKLRRRSESGFVLEHGHLTFRARHGQEARKR